MRHIDHPASHITSTRNHGWVTLHRSGSTHTLWLFPLDLTPEDGKLFQIIVLLSHALEIEVIFFERLCRGITSCLAGSLIVC